ncbi:MAG TPA: hypothetical protein VER03_09595, partial [Bryobacteraceae bacterium]|nr:hypothetical protein [Bryobacteraceae bacterium]
MFAIICGVLARSLWQSRQSIVSELGRVPEGIPVKVKIAGIVTFSDIRLHRTFFEDATGGATILFPGETPGLNPGQRITVAGTATRQGKHVVVTAAEWAIGGIAPVPSGRSLTIETFGAEEQQNRMGSIEGRVEAAAVDRFAMLALTLRSGK